MRTASMMVRKSWVEIVICCGGGVEVLDSATSVGVVLGVEGPEKTEGSESSGTGARRGGTGIEGAGALGSPICSTGRGCSLVGISVASWSSTGPGGGR